MVDVTNGDAIRPTAFGLVGSGAQVTRSDADKARTDDTRSEAVEPNPAGPDPAGPDPAGPVPGTGRGAPAPTVSRRSFLQGAGAGAAAVGLVGVGPLAALLSSPPRARPTFRHASPPPATDRVHYSYRFVATGAPRYSLASGHLPAGLTLHPVTGVLSGTPKGDRTAVFRVRATNRMGKATTRRLEVPVRSGRPVNTVRPVLSDRTPAVGDTLRVTHGTWT